jgi:Lar family restriction alleviation protein
MGDLLPCPFCGARGILLNSLWQNGQNSIDCMKCGAIGPATLDKVAAVISWNRRASGWQPISTAPRDGTEVLLWFSGPETATPHGRKIGRWSGRVHGFPWNCGASSFPADAPTHWQPLPPAPEPTP